MKKLSGKLLIICFLLQVMMVVRAEGDPTIEKKLVTVSGHIKDANTGEVLIGATLFVEELSSGSITNLYGFYSMSVPPGEYNITYAYLGYQPQTQKVAMTKDVTLDIKLNPKSESIEEIVVSSKRKDANIRTPEMGVQKLQSATIKRVPVLMGETDLVKVIQLMPGVQAASEGSSGFSVRGGNPDQNLILLDEATVYNAGHLLGFFSVFNNDAVKDVKLYKGDIPASNGGRLSSLLDVRMKDGNNQTFSGTGGIGLISSRLTLEGPIGGEKTSFVISGRRTYADLFLPLSSDEAIRNNKLHFYDLNAKINHTINANNRLYLSGYFGRDVLKDKTNEMNYGNHTLTFRWNHIFSPRLFANATLIYSNYDYFLGGDEGATSFEWKSNLQDLGIKLDFDWYLNPNNTIEFGEQTIYHNIQPGKAKGKGENALLSEIEVPESHSLEHAFYVSNIQKVTPKLTVKYGLRVSAFQNMGPTTRYYYDSTFEPIDDKEKKYKKGDFYKTYMGWEPRVGATFVVNPSTSVKSSYTRSYQYMHLASNSASGTPLDVWFASSPNVKPQISDQFSVGIFKNFRNNTIEASVETFYKNMQNTIDFKDQAELLLNKHLEGELRFGKSYAYGAEMLVKFNLSKWNGWVSYTLSRSERDIPDINNGNKYLSPYDRTHDCSIVLNRQLGERTSLSANWVYTTGTPATYPVARYEVGGDIVPYYSDRNADRMPDYHRLDLSLTVKDKPRDNRKWQGEWVFSVYNAYGRKNAWAINFKKDKDNPYKMQAEKTSLFSFVPSVTYNFKF